jgi:predicted TIM-barrel fold metal-dependent hydrolase
MPEKSQIIFDALTHVTHDGRWFSSDHDASEQELHRQLDESNTTRAMVVALPGCIKNSFVLDVCQRDPERLIPCAAFNPASHPTASDAARAVRAELKDSAHKALKLHPRLGRFDPLDPRCIAVLEEIASWERPLPIWLCTLLHYRGGVLRKSTVDTIHEIVGQFPSLTFVLAHGGGTCIMQVAEAVRDCPNAYLDISLTMQKYHSSSIGSDLRYLLGHFDRRMLFGSDFPEATISGSLKLFHELAKDIAPEKRSNVLSTNLSRILGIEF